MTLDELDALIDSIPPLTSWPVSPRMARRLRKAVRRPRVKHRMRSRRQSMDR